MYIIQGRKYSLGAAAPQTFKLTLNFMFFYDTNSSKLIFYTPDILIPPLECAGSNFTGPLKPSPTER
jgi:hypothetical protein